uniref:Integrator complex subunit 14 n=1 Tax=Anopheles melas TaxID=34690 RepID=A0A182U4X0_9DIPT
MPTIIALDVSLSMSRPIPNQTTGTGGPGSSGSENVLTYHQLAIQGVNYILDYLSKHARLEFVSLPAFCKFTPRTGKVTNERVATHKHARGKHEQHDSTDHTRKEMCNAETLPSP